MTVFLTLLRLYGIDADQNVVRGIVRDIGARADRYLAPFHRSH